MTDSTTTTGWIKSGTDLPGIIYDGASLAATAGNGDGALVRRTNCGQFAVILLCGGRRKIAKVLPTLDRARAYMHATN